jgi:iron complex outermembrane recepter protein
MGAMRFKHARFLGLLGILVVSTVVVAARVVAQEAGTTQQLERVEVEPPARRAASGTGSGQGFGYDQTIPSGEARSDFPLTPSEVVSPTGRAANLATVPSAISVVENTGITAQGRTGIGDMVRGQPGTWASGYAGNSLNSQISIRGFSQTPAVANRVAILLDGRNMEIPRSEANTGFLFPEIIDRIELMRGDGTIQFGNKAIGGSLNILLKKPRLNPGTYCGVEGGSWRTQREWAGINVVKGPVAAGVFLGNYAQEGFRLFGGNGKNEEFTGRPGPWELLNMIGNVNWKITPRVTFDLAYMYSKQRLHNPNFITLAQWDRRDIRDTDETRTNGGPEERWDAITIGQLLFDGGRLGSLELTASYRAYDTQNLSYLFNTWDYFGRNASYTRWIDSGISAKYLRTDAYGFVRNDLTLGWDLYDGRYGREVKQIPTSGATAGTLQHSNETSSYRGSLSYYVINQLKFWDRVVFGLGYRVEDYDFKDLYYLSPSPYKFVKSYPGWKKSASQYSVNVIYDKQLGSSFYYKHARTYRFPTLTDMINTSTGTTAHPNPIYFLQPEEGTLDEVGIRHWFNPNIYLSAIYYELDMDNEILGEWDVSLPIARRWNANVPLVAHSGIEMEGMVKLTPRWTFSGNFTRQKVLYRSSNINRNNLNAGRLADKWVPANPAQMYNASLAYDNTDWGFSASITGRYFGRRYFQGDDLNARRDQDEVKTGDIAIAQTFFDGSATLYCGINNFNDEQQAFNTYWDYSYLGTEKEYQFWPDAGRTYYMGVKTSLDYDRMKLPTTSDLQRMWERLYGAAGHGVSEASRAGAWTRGLLPL